MEEHELPEERRDRPRSNTWPLPEPPSLPTEPVKSAELPEHTSPANLAKTLLNDGPKKSSRKNAWGNLSYADLITQAIQSSPEKRLTLAEIYEWMVHTIPYFKDKGDSNSSAGWKNSIRHNLSLHSKFIRVQNEGNGKSSWWMLNPDAKAGKTARRPRSGSLDSAPKSEGRKRGRSKKEKIKEIGERPVSPSVVGKNGSRGTSPGNVSPPSTSIESLLPEHFSDSFGRPRTSSNASANSSIPGRLSPIHDQDELDDHELDDCGMSPCGGNMAASSTPNPATDELIKTIEERMYVESPTIMKPSRSPVSMISRGDASPINEMHSPSTPMSSGYDTGYDSSGYLTNHHAQQTHGIFSPLTAAASAFTNVPPQQVTFQNHNGFPEIQQPQPREAHQNLLQYNREPLVDQEMEVQQPPVIYGSLGQNYNQNIGLNHTHNTMSQSAAFSETYFHVLNGGNPSIVINNNPAMAMQSTTVQHQQSPLTMNAYSRVGNQNPELTIAGRYPFPSDLEGFGIAEDLDFDDCDVQSIIQSEMGDGGFDCLNFDQLMAAQSSNTPVSVGEMRLF